MYKAGGRRGNGITYSSRCFLVPGPAHHKERFISVGYISRAHLENSPLTIFGMGRALEWWLTNPSVTFNTWQSDFFTPSGASWKRSLLFLASRFCHFTTFLLPSPSPQRALFGLGVFRLTKYDSDGRFSWWISRILHSKSQQSSSLAS